MSRPARPRSLWLVVFLSAGCAESHGIAGIPPDTALISLSASQWSDLCLWRAQLRGEEPLRYWCRGGVFNEGYECVGGEMPPCEDWRVAVCGSATNFYGERFYYPPTRTDCAATVSEYADCQRALEARVCRSGEPLPECVLFFERCPG